MRDDEIASSDRREGAGLQLFLRAELHSLTFWQMELIVVTMNRPSQPPLGYITIDAGLPGRWQTHFAGFPYGWVRGSMGLRGS